LIISLVGFPSSSSDKDLHKHIQNLNKVFCQPQISPHSAAVIANGGVKKSNVASAIAHIWNDNSITEQFQIQTMNIISIKAELMAICIGLIPAMKNNDTHNIIVITNSITATSKVLKSHVNLFQNIIIPLAARIKSFLSKDNRNAIYYWYCPSKAE